MSSSGWWCKGAGCINAQDLPREVISMCMDAADVACRRRATRLSRHCSNGWCATARRSGRWCTSRSCRAISTRDDLRALVKQGLSHTRGGYKAVAGLFNVPTEHKRLLTFLRKHECHLPEQDLRPATVDSVSSGKVRRAIEETALRSVRP